MGRIIFSSSRKKIVAISKLENLHSCTIGGPVACFLYEYTTLSSIETRFLIGELESTFPRLLTSV